MANARAKGSRIGRPETSRDDIPSAFFRHYPQYKAGKLNKAELARVCEVSYPTVFKYLHIIEE
jgi:hypothetical protein